MMNHTEFIVTPAYGRDYQTIEEARADWDADKDFVIAYPWDAPTYINRSDWVRFAPEKPVWVRFRNLTEKDRLSAELLPVRPDPNIV